MNPWVYTCQALALLIGIFGVLTDKTSVALFALTLAVLSLSDARRPDGH